MELVLEYAPYNKEMADIARAMAADAKTAYSIAVAKPSAAGISKNVKTNARKTYGIVDRVGAKFERHGIFIEKGASRGHGGAQGSSWKDKHGVTKYTNSKSLNKMNTGNRKAKEWLGPVLDNYTKKIADRAAFHMANIAQKLALDAIPVTVKRNKA